MGLPLTVPDDAILPQGTPNPLRADGLYPVLIHPGLFEELADRVEWGEPDANGFYTPTLYRFHREDDPKAVTEY